MCKQYAQCAYSATAISLVKYGQLLQRWFLMNLIYVRKCRFKSHFISKENAVSGLVPQWLRGAVKENLLEEKKFTAPPCMF